MAGTAEKTDPELWERIKAKVTEGDKGGDPGEWSARKAQLAVSEYKKAGGGYKGKKTEENHLVQWEQEEWGTKSGKTSKDTGERYLPKKARETLTDNEYKRTTAKKRADTAKGEQFSRQPDDVARKTSSARHADEAAAKGQRKAGAGNPTLAELRRRAAENGIVGRSRMSKDALVKALGHGGRA